MVKIEVVSNAFVERVIRPKANPERPFTIREQTAYVTLQLPGGVAEKHPSKMVIALDREQKPYEAGYYSLSAESLYVNKYGHLDIGRMRLRPIDPAALKAA
jgi:hypothetical protein